MRVCRPVFAALGVLLMAQATFCAPAPATAPAQPQPPSSPATPPVPADDRLTVDLVAQEPDIVTPTGLTVDPNGRVWVIENNTHFQPKNYAGHPTDRILLMDDFAPDGKARRITQFADGLKDSMSLAVKEAGVYLVTRSKIDLLRDTDNDGKADQTKTLVRLDTKATYPHNGLNGVTFSPDGEFMYFCLGLNTGFPYTVVGSDGSKDSGGGEGGSIWRCRPDGSKVEKIAAGFWNCHDLTFDAFGRLFAVDNDPDDRPPCRLLDIIEGGDYGWQYRNGRRGVHPFTSWNGELPGTLPMVAPTGEAPSGVLAYESNGLPDEYRGQLLVTSWGDHVIQHYKLEAKGASFTARPQTLVRGGVDFRPVGIATAPDGSVFVSDWVDKSYPVHRKGRVWRVRMKTPVKDDGPQPERLAGMSVEELGRSLSDPRRDVRIAAGRALAAMGKDGQDLLVRAATGQGDQFTDRGRIQALWSTAGLGKAEAGRLLNNYISVSTPAVQPEWLRECRRLGIPKGTLTPIEHAEPPAVLREMLLTLPIAIPDFPVSWDLAGPPPWRSDSFVASALITALARSDPEAFHEGRETWGVITALATRRSGRPVDKDYIPDLLRDPSPAVRRIGLQWVGEERLKEYAADVPKALKAGPVSRDLLAAYLACQEKLATAPADEGKPPAERSAKQLAADFLFDVKQDAAVRSLALQLVDPADPKIPSKKLIALVGPMGIEAVRALTFRADAESQQALRDVAADPEWTTAARKEAAAGLARSAADAATRKVLLDLLNSGVRLEALRSLRGRLDRAEAARLLADLRDPATTVSDDDRREWAAQLLMAFKAAPDALTDADRKDLESAAGPRPQAEDQWQQALAAGGDADAGRRVFFHANAAKCYVCHTVAGRGGNVGPDLSHVAAAMDRRKIVESILDPSREIAPLYVAVVLELKDGTSVEGVAGLEDVGQDYVLIHNALGQAIKAKAADVARRREEKLSLMPAGLPDGLTVREFRDLVAFLAEQK